MGGGWYETTDIEQSSTLLTHACIVYLLCKMTFFHVQQDEFHLKWSPDDLTQQDVASLYSAQADSWTLVDEFSKFKRV